MTKANDKQIGGSHYRKHGIYQPWDVLTAWLTPEEYRGWQKGTAIVYLARERDKNGDQDIEKAGHHIHKLVEVLQVASAVEKAADTIADAFESRAEHDKPYSPNRAPFVKALWDGFTERHSAQFKALGITAEHLARAGAELTRHLEQNEPTC